MKSHKTAIVVTETVRSQSSGSAYQWFARSVVLPVTRIAKAEPAYSAITRVQDSEVPPKTRLTLRTPEGYLLVAEAPERIAALMNGES